jgi:ABC-2 type transport system permease protein
MISLFKKELNSFFGSITGYMVIAIFLIASSLFLWVLPGSQNIIEGQRSTLKAFFDLAPWLYLFLIPAITMRMLAEEKRMGTIEMLITRPLTTWQIVLAKYLSALLLVAISLLPTMLYFYTVYQLGNPIGNIDTGATWGSFMGLFMLASAYISIGLFASSLTSNQVISFLAAIVISFISYSGFNFIASIGFHVKIQNILFKLGIEEHYSSISRGVIDSRDIFYFIFASLLFLFLTQSKLRVSKTPFLYNTRNTAILFILALFLVWGVNHRFFRIDLTAEKRYSLSDISKSILSKQDQSLVFEIYLSGKLPSGMKEFRDAIVEKVEDFNAYSTYRIMHETIDIYKISNNSERNQLIEMLIDAGIQPVNFGHKTTEGLSTKQIFPGIIIRNKEQAVAINLLNNNPLIGPDENLRQSIELLEYEFIRGIRLLQQTHLPRIAFLSKEGNANLYETSDFRYSLSENYEVIDIEANDLFHEEIKCLILAAPTKAFTDEEKLHIDQFIMKGGSVLWCIDPVHVSIDSLSAGLSTLAFEKGLNLRDQLFRYGVRINPDLVQDAFCLEYPVNTAPAGQQARFTPAPFYYAPIALPNPNHPVSRNLNNVMLEFASSLEPVGGQNNSTTILATSPYGRSIQTPAEVSLLSATTPPDSRLFNQPNIPIGILLEGKFESAFANRMTSHLGIDIISEKSPETKMIVIADGDIIKNKVRTRQGQTQIMPLGQDQFTGQIYGNREFLLNCINYLSDDTGIMEIRSRVVRLRILDKVKIRDEKLKWQLINSIVPLAIFIVFGFLFSFIRRKRYN